MITHRLNPPVKKSVDARRRYEISKISHQYFAVLYEMDSPQAFFKPSNHTRCYSCLKENRRLKRESVDLQNLIQTRDAELEAIKDMATDTFAECLQLQNQIEKSLTEGQQKERELENLSMMYQKKSQLLDSTLVELASLEKSMPSLKKRKRDFERKETMIEKRDKKIEKLREELKEKDKACKASEKECYDLWQELLLLQSVEEENDLLKAFLDDMKRALEDKEAQEKKMRELEEELSMKNQLVLMNENMLARMDVDIAFEAEEWKDAKKTFKAEIKELKQEVDRLNVMVEELQQPVISTFQGGRYSDAMRRCCMSLSTLGISVCANFLMSSRLCCLI
ncbi:hypothetical protein CAPTEDRAFT_212840 [Capitella teleta]|uniref:Uncharacterized protein n=1 Tax=Capitella teleta TaxID=283909 RepID=R7UY89_CAPTE|nr:hypothetical protein CAPTEDRAFT_212840 [Capitella teleta]|eukprot:ELU11217.1 hypothetical protein CAPTEDRAFT_212840 [Capitella teleta]